MHLVRGDIKTKNSLNVGNHPNQWGLRFLPGFSQLKGLEMVLKRGDEIAQQQQ